MPRQSHVVLANTPHHILQRGHNRQTVFSSNRAFEYYRLNPLEFKNQFGVRIYAYCLLENHVHLLVNPGSDPDSPALLMKRVAGRQTRFFNKIEKRSGTLWEGRYKSSIVSPAEYLPACCRYIETNPARKGIVDDPAAYPWSSCMERISDCKDMLTDPSPGYLALGSTIAKRQRPIGNTCGKPARKKPFNAFALASSVARWLTAPTTEKSCQPSSVFRLRTEARAGRKRSCNNPLSRQFFPTTIQIPIA